MIPYCRNKWVTAGLIREGQTAKGLTEGRASSDESYRWRSSFVCEPAGSAFSSRSAPAIPTWERNSVFLRKKREYYINWIIETGGGIHAPELTDIAFAFSPLNFIQRYIYNTYMGCICLGSAKYHILFVTKKQIMCYNVKHNEEERFVLAGCCYFLIAERRRGKKIRLLKKRS